MERVKGGEFSCDSRSVYRDEEHERDEEPGREKDEKRRGEVEKRWRI